MNFQVPRLPSFMDEVLSLKVSQICSVYLHLKREERRAKIIIYPVICIHSMWSQKCQHDKEKWWYKESQQREAHEQTTIIQIYNKLCDPSRVNFK